MCPSSTQVLRPPKLVDRTVEMIRSKLETGAAQLSDVLLSERQLVKTCRVSRTTVRRALQQLIRDGYLVSHPRLGYRVTAGSERPAAGGLVSFLHGTPSLPWTWTPYQLSLLKETQEAAAGSGRDLLVTSLYETAPMEAADRLLKRGATGAIVDTDDPEVAVTVGRAGMPVVMIDCADPRVESVVQDNFGGAFQATLRLVARGHRRIAWVGCDHSGNPRNPHICERLGGHLAALATSGLAAPEEWRLLLRPGDPAGTKLLELVSRANGPTAAVVLWPEILPEIGAALAQSGKRPDLVVWWGGTPGAREDWAGRFPGVPVPDGMTWSVAEMARKALARLEDVCRDRAEPPARTLVTVRMVAGTPNADAKTR